MNWPFFWFTLTAGLVGILAAMFVGWALSCFIAYALAHHWESWQISSSITLPVVVVIAIIAGVIQGRKS